MTQTKQLEKYIRQGISKKSYLLGEDESGTRYFLAEPSWDCGWYWGFGYIAGYEKDKPREQASHEHADHFMSKWFTSFNNSEPRLSKTTFDEEEGWRLSELFKRFYTLKEAAEMFYFGGVRVNHDDEYLKDEALAKRINEVLIPKVTAEIIKILTPTT
jgi:hypothetical protein